MAWNIKGGVIIIGSLLWQDYLYKDDDTVRLDWRNSHLDIENKIPVKVPIRYGRKSNGGIITMVFSNQMARRKGIGYVVPFKNAINSLNELLCECIALSKAEGMQGDFVTNWGVLAYLLNDSIIEAETKKEIVKLFRQQKNEYQKKVKEEKKFKISQYKVNAERSCVTKSLKLDINWVTPVTDSDKSKLDELHFLLATPTKPTDETSCEAIAETVKADTKRKYFDNNRANGIITYDDSEIDKYKNEYWCGHTLKGT